MGLRQLIIAVLTLLAFSYHSQAQYGNQFQYNSFFNSQGAGEFPSEFGRDIRTFSVNLLSNQVFVGNTIADVNWLYNLSNASGTNVLGAGGDSIFLPQAVLSHLINETPETNSLVLGNNLLAPLSFAFKIKTGEEKKELLTFGFNYRNRVASTFGFGKGLARLFWEGNAAYEDEQLNIGDIFFNFHAYNEYAVNMAFPLLTLKNTIDLRAGIALKYLAGAAAIHTERSDILLETGPNGEYLDFNVDYLVNFAAPVSFEDIENGNSPNISPNSLVGGIGNGIGIDIGASAEILSNLRAYISVNDIGSVRYSENNTNLSSEGTVRFNGVRVDAFDLENGSDVSFDTLLTLFEPERTNNVFNVPLATRLTMGGRFGIKKNETKKGMEYFTHNLFFTYIQGFNRAAGNSTIPFINAGYTFNFKNFLSFGLNGGYGGIYGANLGTTLSLRGGPVRFGIGSNSIFGVFTPHLVKGADFTMNLAIAI